MLLALWVAVLGVADAAGVALTGLGFGAAVGVAALVAVGLLASRRWVLGGAALAAVLGLVLGHRAAAPVGLAPALATAVAAGGVVDVEATWLRPMVERDGA